MPRLRVALARFGLAPLGRFDAGLLRVLRTHGHSPAAEQVMGAFGAAGEWGAIWSGSAFSAAALDRPRRGRWLLAAVVAPLAIGLNFCLKTVARRARPTLEGLPPLAGAPSALAFPSAHATSSFAAATAMGRVAPEARPVLYALAAIICLTRPYLGMHYPSDVLAGGALGMALGRAVPGLDRNAGPVETPPPRRR